MFSGSAATSTVRCCDCVTVIEYFNVRAYVCMVVNIAYKFLCVSTSHTCVLVYAFGKNVRRHFMCVCCWRNANNYRQSHTLSSITNEAYMCIYIYLFVLHSHATAENDEKVVRLRREVLFSHWHTVYGTFETVKIATGTVFFRVIKPKCGFNLVSV